MKKRLLLSLMAMCMGVSGFALSEGEYVYTPQGRFQITGANAASSNFADFTGWTLISSTDGALLETTFDIVSNGYADGLNSAKSLVSTAGEGMYFKFEPTGASESYVVSFKMKGAALDNVKYRIDGDNYTGYNKELNLLKVAGNEANTYTYPATEGEVIANTAEELTEDWQTFNYAIVGDGTARTWFISLTGMNSTIEIADLQIAPALQVADLRQRDAMLEKLNVYKNCYAWGDALLEDMGIDEIILALKGLGDESSQSELEENLSTAQEVLETFISENMDDYLAGNNDNYLGIKTTSGNTQKVSNLGDWTATTTGRAFWSSGAYPDLGHYGGNTAWNWNDVDSPMGVYMQKELDPGSYVFGIEGLAALRESPTSNSWTTNEGWNPAYGVAYIVNASGDTIVSVVKDLKSATYTPFLITAKIEEAGTYEIGFKAYCKDAYKSLKNGSVTYVANASIWGKNENVYNQKQLAYEADVREQITTGRDALTKATEYLNAEYFWGKAELQDSVTVTEPKIAVYEAMSQDEIIATFDADAYVKENRTKNAEEGLLVFEVYNEAVKGILAANKKFLAVNDTLNSLQVAIDDAKTTLAMRLYSAATGTADLQSAIEDAEGLYASLKKLDYSEDNAFSITSKIEALSEAVNAFKASVPADAITTIVDIDFEQDAVLDETTSKYTITGAAGTMEFSNFYKDQAEAPTNPFQQGFWSNGEQLWKGYVRVGNGTGTVTFDPTIDGSMGTNILKVACDFYVQGLTGRQIGFFLKDADDAEVFGIYHNFYDGKGTTTNTCEVDLGMIWAKAGGSYNDASPADAPEETLTANPLQKSHVEVILDYGRKSMYCTVNSINGSAISKEIALDAVIAKFVLQANYNVDTRRCWFDNLKIERVAAGETTPFDGIQEINTNDTKVVAPSKVLKNGRIIINGKYGINGVLIK